MSDRHVSKAESFVAAWQRRYGTTPGRGVVTLCCGVAELETQCGDGMHGNWGAVTRRAMTAEERAAVHEGRVPSPRDPFEALHGDSDPVAGKYQTWFWAFPPNAWTSAQERGDVAGADRFINTLIDKRPSIHASIGSLDAAGIARLMYLSGYYAGFHDPRPRVGEHVEPGALTAGQQANIADYASGVQRHQLEFSAALGTWQPALPDCMTVAGLQRALTMRRVAVLREDGIAGPLTTAASVKLLGRPLTQGSVTVGGVVVGELADAARAALGAQ